MSGPYLVFHLLFQDTSFVRYALPLVPAVVFLAVQGVALAASACRACRGGRPRHVGASWWPRRCSRPTAPSPVQPCAWWPRCRPRRRDRGPAPWRCTTPSSVPSRPRRWISRPSCPRRRRWSGSSWRSTGGPAASSRSGSSPIPCAADLALIDPRSRLDVTEFTWPLVARPAFGGMRPSSVRWYRMPAPGWFVEEGWALTPETSGMARLMGRGPADGAHRRPGAAPAPARRG